VGCSNGQEPFALSLMSHRRGAGEKREKQTKSTSKIIGGGGCSPDRTCLRDQIPCYAAFAGNFFKLQGI
jgi:hypothetical protein